MKNKQFPLPSEERVTIKRISLDKGPDERWQHATREIKLIEKDRVLVARAVEESVIDVLHIHSLITNLEKEAAIMLRQDFLNAGLMPNMVSNYNPYFTGSASTIDDETEEKERAYKNYREAMNYMTGAVNGVVESVVCYDQMPAQEKVAFLRVGLKKLIKFYSISGVDGFLNQKVNQAAAGQVATRRSRGAQSTRGVGALH